MRRFIILAVVLALLAAACGFADYRQQSSIASTSVTGAGEETTAGAAQPTEPTTQPPSASTNGTAGGETIAVDLTSCGSAGDFAILCEAYDLLKAEYVDPLEDATLASGAIQGIEEYLDASDGSSQQQRITCPIPSSEFEATCAAAAEALATHDTTISSVAEAAVYGLFTFGLDDPNSQYLPPDVLARIQEDQTGTISGIGSLVVTEEVDADEEGVRCNVINDSCRMHIVSVIKGGPAEAAGLRSGDIMLTVDGESIDGWTDDEVVSQVRGPEGEPVTIEIERDGEAISFTIVRAPITVPVISMELFDNGVGYVKLSQFTNNSGRLFRDALTEMIDAGTTRLIIDLQNNPGGALNAAISVASEFLDGGMVVRTESPLQDRDYDVTSGGVATSDELEIVVLVNRGSASASEVVAGVLQETGRAVIIGESTFGKNTVQQRFGLSNGGAVKLTIARWVTPAGADFGGDGILPDIFVDIPDDATTDLLIDQALAYFGVTR